MTDDGLIFEVKGNIHPEDRIIAYLRYVRDEKGNRVSNDGERYRKIYGLEERESFLSKYHPEYLWNSSVHGCVVQAVPLDSMATVLNPIDGMRQIRDMRYYASESQKTVSELAEALVNEARISWSDIGITGSHLVGLQTNVSDIDLVVYGSSPARKLHSRLCSGNRIPSLMKYKGEHLERHLQFRWPGLAEWMKELRIIEGEKCLQGMYSSYDFYIRAVKKPDEVQQSFYDFSFESKGEYTVEGHVVSDLDSIFTPCVYCIRCPEFPDLQHIVSFRGRFAEHVKKGMKIRAKGKLEVVVDNSRKQRYEQLVLGEKSSDFLVPL